MKWSRTVRDEAIRLAKRGLTDKAIAKCLGVSQQTLSGWRTRKPDFRMEMDRAKLPTKAARRLLSHQHISPISRQGQHLIELAWQVHREQEAKQPEELSSVANGTQPLQITPEELALMEQDLSGLLNDQDFQKILEGMDIDEPA